MDITSKQALIAALRASIAPKLNAAGVLEGGYGKYLPVEEADGSYTLFAAPEINTFFEPIENFKYNLVNTTFTVELTGCAYDETSKAYTWNGNDYQISFGDFNINLLFGLSNGATAYDFGAIFACEGVKELTELEDSEIAVGVLQPLFDAMSDADKKALAQAAFEKIRMTTDAPISTKLSEKEC